MNKNKFNIGDTVKCIDRGGAALTIGSEYKVLRTKTEDGFEFITIKNDNGILIDMYPRHFEKVENPNQMNKNKITYHIRLLEDGKFNKHGQATKDDIIAATETYNLCVKDNPNRRIYAIFMEVDGVETLIAQSEIPNPAPKINGHEMKYDKNARWAKFGCAEISLDELYLAFKAMSYGAMGVNRKIVSITLCSGVSITNIQLGEIFKYVEYVNGSKYNPKIN